MQTGLHATQQQGLPLVAQAAARNLPKRGIAAATTATEPEANATAHLALKFQTEARLILLSVRDEACVEVSNMSALEEVGEEGYCNHVCDMQFCDWRPTPTLYKKGLCT